MKKFRCGLCKEKEFIWRTRKGLKQHLREDHGIKSELTNKKGSSSLKDKASRVKGGGLSKQQWWIEEEI